MNHCKASIPGGGYYQKTCSNKAKHGSDYCGIHSPEAKAKRRAKSEEDYQHLSNIRKERSRQMAHASACVTAIESIGGDPESVGKLLAALKRLLSLEDRSTANDHELANALVDAKAAINKTKESTT